MEFVKGWPKEQEYWIFVLIPMIQKKKEKKECAHEICMLHKIWKHWHSAVY